jgi:hypothetical protein
LTQTQECLSPDDRFSERFTFLMFHGVEGNIFDVPRGTFFVVPRVSQQHFSFLLISHILFFKAVHWRT